MTLSDKQFFILAGAALIGGYVVYSKGEDVARRLDPTDPNNVVNQLATEAAAAATGNEQALQNGADIVFSALDLLNPWAPEYRRNYAKSVLFGD